MNKLEKYLEEFSHESTLYIIGPLASEISVNTLPLIFVDGGARFRKGAEGISLGDGDSFEGELDLKLNKNKDFSDLSFALKHIPQHFSEIHLIGFLGERRDHELMNLGEVSLFMKTRTGETKVFFDTSIIAFASGSYKIEHAGTFSLFGFEDSDLSVAGDCDYPFKGELRGLSSHGLSNIGSGEISILTSRPLFFFKT